MRAAVGLALWQSGCGDPAGTVAGDTAALAETAQASTQAAAAPDPASKLYLRYHEARSGIPERHNHVDLAQGARQITISAKTLILNEQDDVDVLSRFNGASDVGSLSIRADRLVVGTKIRVPAAELWIHARELVFDDSAGEAGFDLTPLTPTTRASTDRAADGIDGSSAHVFVQTVKGIDGPARFVLDGGEGQPAKQGAQGEPGESRSLWYENANATLRYCADNGTLVTKECTFGVPGYCVRYRYKESEITLSELKNNVIIAAADDGKMNYDPELPQSGGPATAPGIPGSASDGGTLTTNHAGVRRSVHLAWGDSGDRGDYARGGSPGTPRYAIKIASAECDFFPGNIRLVLGEVTETGRTSFGPGKSAPLPQVFIGQPGSTALATSNAAWVHPEGVARIIEFSEDAFLNGARDLARAELTSLAQQLESHPKRVDPTFGISEGEQVALLQQLQHVEALLRKLDTGVDYYGNPGAWVPALSLEANQLVFSQESEWAIRTIYVADWLLNANSDAERNTTALAEAQRVLRDQARVLEEDFNERLDRIPGLKGAAAIVSRDMAALQTDLELTERRLVEQARDNVEDRKRGPLWKRGLRIIGGLVRALPVGQPITGGLGALAETVAQFDADDPWATVFKIPEVVGEFTKETKTEEAGKKTSEKLAEAREGDSTRAKLKEVLEVAKPLLESLDKNKSLFQPVKVADDELKAELEKLKKSDEAFIALTERAKTLLEEKQAFASDLTETLTSLADITIEINDTYLKVADVSADLTDAASVALSRRADLALRKMRSDAIRRLLKYQYLLAKSYEYRTLRPYPGDFSLVRMFEEMARLANSTGADGTLSAEQYASLFAIYRAELARIVESISDDYNANHTEQTERILYTLSPEELESLNRGDVLSLNLFEQGLFRSDRHDIRIVGLEVHDIDATQTGSASRFGYVDIDIRHDGMSRLWRNGAVHVFQHYHEGTAPFEWSSRYDRGGQLTHSEPSAAADSLLRSLVEGTDAEIMMFSRPSAWANLNLTKSVRADGDLDFTLDRVVLELRYDYVRSNSAPWDDHRDQQDAIADGLFRDWLERPANDDERSWVRLNLDLGSDEDAMADSIQRIYRAELAELDVDAMFGLRFGRRATEDELAWGTDELLRGRDEAELLDYAGRIIDIVAAESGGLPTYDDLVDLTAAFDRDQQYEPIPLPFPTPIPFPTPVPFPSSGTELPGTDLPGTGLPTFEPCGIAGC